MGAHSHVPSEIICWNLHLNGDRETNLSVSLFIISAVSFFSFVSHRYPFNTFFSLSSSTTPSHSLILTLLATLSISFSLPPNLYSMSITSILGYSPFASNHTRNISWHHLCFFMSSRCCNQLVFSSSMRHP